MPFIFPIQNFDEPAGAAAVLLGGTSLAAALSVANNLRAVSAGAGALTASLSAGAALEAVSAGAGALTASLRLNDEPNVFPAAAVAVLEVVSI